jgi:hypothetical protein
MQIIGIDFSSTPSKRKPIVCAYGRLKAQCLHIDRIDPIYELTRFEALLHAPGSWVAGIDAPFGQSRRFIENMDWPRTWSDYVAHTSTMTRAQFRASLDAYRANRPVGDKEHRRLCDIQAGAISPQKLYGTPVGLMFFEVAPRLLNSPVGLPGLRTADPKRLALETYPGILARQIVGRRSYKQDATNKQTADQALARMEIVRAITNGLTRSIYGFDLKIAPQAFVDDPTGDQLDCILCAIQAAWAWSMRANHFGMPRHVDPLEGWIADPALLAGLADTSAVPT